MSKDKIIGTFEFEIFDGIKLITNFIDFDGNIIENVEIKVESHDKKLALDQIISINLYTGLDTDNLELMINNLKEIRETMKLRS